MKQLHKPNIFREIRNNIKDIRGQIEVKLDVELNQEKLDALKEISRYTKSLSYVKHADTKKRLDYYLKKSHLNCRTTAAALGIENTNVIEQTVKYVSDKLSGLIAEPMNKIMQSTDSVTIADAITYFRIVTKQERPMEYFLQGFSSMLPQQKYEQKIGLRECGNEIAILLSFSKLFVEEILGSKCDNSKLAHVLSILSSRNGSVVDREAVSRIFRGDFSKTAEGQTRRAMTQVNQMFQWWHDQNPYND
ncbi:hypothetical protein [Paenibacillus sp. FSL R7-0337]|uniref:hypothetical protein n=1 Tax=Paenibacillus sp. FSL R7-0337 TaxID=1926588 RepID=UPI00096D861D|nr:hypothetical protein [Paenibacillus sp. FSL R7-0337]OMF88749.1 hypothetical protein BK147_26455 [Paenibacillus sp. FSL R7-0337]